MRKYYIGVLLVLLSAIGFGMMPIFALYAYDWNVSVFTLLFTRFLLATVILFTIIFVKFNKVRINKKQLGYLFLLGCVFYTLQSIFYFSSVKYISASLAVLLFSIYPVLVAAISYFVEKEKITITALFSIGLSLLGLTLVLGTSFQSIHYYGVCLSLGAAVVYSFYIVIGNRVVKQLPSLITSSFVTLFASVSLLILGLCTNTIQFNFDIKAWGPILGVSLFSTVISIFGFFKGLEFIGSTRASIISMVEPLVTVILSALLFSERLTMYQTFGGICVLSGAVLVIFAKQQVNSKENTISLLKRGGKHESGFID